VKVRAIIFDIYGTLLEVAPPPPNAAVRWLSLWTETLGFAPRLSLQAFLEACDKQVKQEQSRAKRSKILYPDTCWPVIVRKAIPELEAISYRKLDEFLYQHAQLRQTTRLMPGMAEFLNALPLNKIIPGIAANAQPYTLRELDQAMKQAGVPRSLFRHEFCFWSFEHGFAKPNPHAFRTLTSRLEHHRVLPEQILMVGDQRSEDILPAQSQGWLTWQLVLDETGKTSSRERKDPNRGGLEALLDRLKLDHAPRK